MGDYQDAAASFKRGLAIEPTNASLTSALANAEARISEDVDEDTPALTTPGAAGGAPGGGPAGMDFGAMAEMMRGMGGGGDAAGGPGGMGGLPAGLGGMLNNPMMMQMAQQMMGNGGLEVS